MDEPAPRAILGDGLLDATMNSCPQPVYEAMRAHAPVIRADDARVLLVDHEGVMTALRDAELFSSDMDAVRLGNVRPLIPLQIDPPDHIKFRKLLDPLFSPREVARLEPEVRRLTTELIDAFAGDGRVELNEAFAVPLPCTVFLALLGLPQEDLPTFLRIKDGIIRPPGMAGREADRIRRATATEIYEYFAPVIEARRAEPRDDLISSFVAAEVDGIRLSNEDILDICFLFLIAGLDTVTATLTCSVAYLAQHPEHRDALARDLTQVPAAVEELLRWESPVPGVARVCTRDVDIAGERIAAGTRVTVLLGSANTDEREFPEPSQVDFGREGNRHLAFGGGIHRCLGSHLARLELRVALEELHRRIPDYELEPDTDLVYAEGLRSVEHLPLRFTPTPLLGAPRGA
ncbi:MAG TPA: cytochrome P450, partial [Acidimicrobiia bacterium]